MGESLLMLCAPGRDNDARTPLVQGMSHFFGRCCVAHYHLSAIKDEVVTLLHFWKQKNTLKHKVHLHYRGHIEVHLSILSKLGLQRVEKFLVNFRNFPWEVKLGDFDNIQSWNLREFNIRSCVITENLLAEDMTSQLS